MYQTKAEATHPVRSHGRENRKIPDASPLPDLLNELFTGIPEIPTQPRQGPSIPG